MVQFDKVLSTSANNIFRLRGFLLHNQWMKKRANLQKKVFRQCSNLKLQVERVISRPSKWIYQEKVKARLLGVLGLNCEEKEKFKKSYDYFAELFRVFSNTIVQNLLSGIAKVKIVKFKFQNWKNCEVFDTERIHQPIHTRNATWEKEKKCKKGKLIFLFSPPANVKHMVLDR